jgi:hypothetical protein
VGMELCGDKLSEKLDQGRISEIFEKVKADSGIVQGGKKMSTKDMSKDELDAIQMAVYLAPSSSVASLSNLYFVEMQDDEGMAHSLQG